jgi:cytochrome b561
MPRHRFSRALECRGDEVGDALQVSSELTQTNKSVGVAVFALMVVRLCRRILTTGPKPDPAGPLLRRAPKAAHIALYGLLLLMPLSGWLMATTTPVRVPTVVFGLFVVAAEGRV